MEVIIVYNGVYGFETEITIFQPIIKLFNFLYVIPCTHGVYHNNINFIAVLMLKEFNLPLMNQAGRTGCRPKI